MARFGLIGLFLAGMLPFLYGCADDDAEDTGIADRVLLVYMAADNNLSAYASASLNRLCEGMAQAPANTRSIVYLDTQGESPRLLEVTTNGAETLYVWDEALNSTSADVMRSVIDKACEMAPASRYGLVLWSHGLGWLPVTATAYYASRMAENGNGEWPAVKFFGQDYNPDYVDGMETDELVAAIPDGRFDYILFDACLMGSVEVLYALREKADYIVSSPAEVITDSFPYDDIAGELLQSSPDLRAVCDAYYRYYAGHADARYHAATVSLVETAQLEPLADATAAVLAQALANDADALGAMDVSQVQTLDRDNPHVFFDMESVMDALEREETIGNVTKETWTECLHRAVVYERHTPTFFSLSLDECCGITMYVPLNNYADLNEAYALTEWYRRCY